MISVSESVALYNPSVIDNGSKSGVNQESKMRADKSEDTSGQRADKTLR